MKLALLGSSPVALEAALRFHAHEAAWSWFNADEEEIEVHFTSASLNWTDCTTDLGRKTLKEAGATSFEWGEFSWSKWKTYYYMPLVEYFKTQQSIKPHRVVSIAKRFLTACEEIPGKTRFHDLFRIIYQLNPEEFINEQKEINTETYQRLSEEFIQSLQSSLEMYEDFDLVLDLRRATVPTSIAASGMALGEGRIGKEHVSYGTKSLSYLPGPEVREIALVGSNDVAVQVLINLHSWLKDPRHRLFLVSHEENPFTHFLENAREEVREKLLNILEEIDAEFQVDANGFHEQLRDWQQLDDFIQVKKPRPVEPIPRLVFFSGHNVTAIDQLIDKRRIFLTVEKPDWREGIRHPENNYLDLKTIGIDEVIVATGFKKTAINVDINPNEVGLLGLAPTRPLYKNAWKEDLNALDSIEQKVFTLFSPASPS